MLLLGHTLRIHQTIEQLDRANHTEYRVVAEY